ncbi:PREDICTED: spermatogenesis-associated protein 31E1-like, partial [Hipposideros armiger]|uniref:Spermatogenesis-associated protein 31E1-like n=1 Tax=Hipposideros armiger TaxID=186990 RepID=A0A8B7QKP1_HIPAR
VFSPRSRQLPEAHIGRAWGRPWKSLPLKVRKPIERFKLEKARHSPFLRSPITCSATRASRALSRARLAAFFGKPPQRRSGENVIIEDTGSSPLPVPGAGVITEESGFTPESDLHTSSPVCEEVQSALGRTPPGDGRGPSEAPLIVQEDRPPSQNLLYPFVGRIWHSGSVVGAKKDSLELSPRAAVARKEPSDKTVAETSRDSCQSITILELNSESQSSRAEGAREAVEALDASVWVAILGPCVPSSPRDSNVDLRRSVSAGSSKSPSLPMQSANQDPEVPRLDAQLSEFELRELGESDNQTQGSAASVLLEDSVTGVSLQDCATHMLMQDCRSDVLLAADMLARQASLFGSHSMATGDMSASQVLHDVTSSEGSSQGESLGLQDQYKRQGKTSVPTDEREHRRSPSPGQPDEGLAGLRAPRAIRMSTGQEKDSVESLRSQPFWLMENRQASPEDFFKNKMKQLQCIFPRKGKGLEHTLQKGQPSAATAHRWEPAESGSVLNSRAVEAQVVLKTVGHILQETMTVHRKHSDSEFSWCKTEHHAPAGPQVCSHRALSYTEQRKLMKGMACGHQATKGKGHHSLHKSSWATDRNSQCVFPPREPALPRPCQHGLRGTVSSGSSRYSTGQWPIRRSVSSVQPGCSFHTSPGRNFP